MGTEVANSLCKRIRRYQTTEMLEYLMIRIRARELLKGAVRRIGFSRCARHSCAGGQQQNIDCGGIHRRKSCAQNKSSLDVSANSIEPNSTQVRRQRFVQIPQHSIVTVAIPKFLQRKTLGSTAINWLLRQLQAHQKVVRIVFPSLLIRKQSGDSVGAGTETLFGPIQPILEYDANIPLRSSQFTSGKLSNLLCKSAVSRISRKRLDCHGSLHRRNGT
jgi:hypothetical protein